MVSSTAMLACLESSFYSDWALTIQASANIFWVRLEGILEAIRDVSIPLALFTLGGLFPFESLHSYL